MESKLDGLYNTPWNLASSIKAHQTQKKGEKMGINRQKTGREREALESKERAPIKHSQEVRETLEEQFNR